MNKDKFKKGQLVKIDVPYEGSWENIGIVIKYSHVSKFTGISYYEVYWMKELHDIPEMWITKYEEVKV